MKDRGEEMRREEKRRERGEERYLWIISTQLHNQWTVLRQTQR